MEVYILCYVDGYDSYIIGVYDSYSKAEKAIKEQDEDWETYLNFYNIQRYIVQ